MRLVGGSEPQAGRLEIQYNGQWGTVCRDGGYWNSRGDESAKVVCQQLGYSGQSHETSTSLFGEGSGWVWTSVNFCAGDVDFVCVDDAAGRVMPTKGSTYCNHDDDVGIICDGERSLLTLHLPARCFKNIQTTILPRPQHRYSSNYHWVSED